MSYRTYHPKRGDLVHLNFSPSAGHEMADRHYGLVLSPVEYNRKSGMAIVCAITSRIRGGPFEVEVPEGALPEKKGVGVVKSVIVADAVRQVDYREREMAFVSEAPKDVLEEVVERLVAVVEGE
jgi:mRNA interferase MazF